MTDFPMWTSETHQLAPLFEHWPHTAPPVYCRWCGRILVYKMVKDENVPPFDAMTGVNRGVYMRPAAVCDPSDAQPDDVEGRHDHWWLPIDVLLE